MKFLVDNAFSPLVTNGLRQTGHDAAHVRDYRMHQVDDADILARAARKDRIVISTDTDFGTLLALREEAKPSVIPVRGASQRRPDAQVTLLVANLPGISEALERGSVVVFEEARVRIRSLPIGRPKPLR